MKTRVDIYICGERLPISLNGYARHLLTTQPDGPSAAAVAALRAFFLVADDTQIAGAMSEFCRRFDCTRNWLIEYAICRSLDGLHQQSLHLGTHLSR